MLNVGPYLSGLKARETNCADFLASLRGVDARLQSGVKCATIGAIMSSTVAIWTDPANMAWVVRTAIAQAPDVMSF